MEDCLFCKIIKNEIPSTKVYEDEKVLAFLDISPVNIGHTLVIPKEHYRNALETPDELILELFKVGKKVAKSLQKNGAHGINITLNNEKASGQTVFHTHLHVIPRFENDGHDSWTHKNYKKDEMPEIAKKITAEL
jgi:histidine triad (HIT) family protein